MMNTPRTWRFWALWALLRLAFGLSFLALGWMPAFWFLLGSLLPDAAWYLKDERLKLMTRATEPLCRTIARLETENDALKATVIAYQRRDGRVSISSIAMNSTWWSGSTH